MEILNVIKTQTNLQHWQITQGKGTETRYIQEADL
jgi:hypothetical protein